MNTQRTVLISILNWNTADLTVECVNSVLALEAGPAVTVQVMVIDNGSRAEEWASLQRQLSERPVTLRRQESNLGFAGGHNVAIDIAIEQQLDFIWLVNSDTLIEPTVLTKLLAIMDEDARCGAVSPVVRAAHDAARIDFCGAQHDWKNLESHRPDTIEEVRRLETANPDDMWLAGTVVLFRVEALRQVGGLDAKLFAYFEDDDIGVRLARGGWRNRMAFDANVAHSQPNVKERPAYYFYLLYRNSFYFWERHTPAQWRRFLRLRLLDRALFTANRLYRRGFDKKAEACMLGALDGMQGRMGVPDLQRPVPASMQMLRRLLLLKQARLIRQVEP